jgi:hypothetical protein
MQVLLPAVGSGNTSPCLADGENDWVSAMGGHVFVGWHGVIFEHCQVLPWVVKDEGMSVNEAVYTGTVGTDGKRRWFKVDMVAMGWCCSAPKGNEMSSSVGGVAARP